VTVACSASSTPDLDGSVRGADHDHAQTGEEAGVAVVGGVQDGAGEGVQAGQVGSAGLA
jgi:hypothetical protein